MLLIRGLCIALASVVLCHPHNFTLRHVVPHHLDHFPTHLLTLHPYLPLNKFHYSDSISHEPGNSTANSNATSTSNVTDDGDPIGIGKFNDDENATDTRNITASNSPTLTSNTNVPQNITLSSNSSSTEKSSSTSPNDAARWSYIRSTTSHRTDCHKPGLKANYIHFHRPIAASDHQPNPNVPTPTLAFYTPWHLWYPNKVRRVLQKAGFEIDAFPEGQWTCGWVHEQGVRKGNVWLGRVEWAVQCRNGTWRENSEGPGGSEGRDAEAGQGGGRGNPNCFYGRPERDLVDEVRRVVRSVYPEEELVILLSVSLVLGIAVFWVCAWWVRRGRVCGAFQRWEGRRRIRGLE